LSLDVVWFKLATLWEYGYTDV